MQICYTEFPYGKMYVILDSKRDGGWLPPGLRDYPPSLIKDGIGWVQIGDPNRHPTTCNGFGNLEVSPPLKDVGGKDYPFGRIYYGEGAARDEMDPLVIKFLKAQEVQDPVGLNTKWLLVGHVDEFISFIPSDTGFRVAIASPKKAIELLTKAPDVAIPVYEATYTSTFSAPWVSTPISNTTQLLNMLVITEGLTSRAYNEKIDKTLFGDPHGTGGLLSKIKDAFGSGLTKDLDVVEVPVLFWCPSGNAEALTPDLVNRAVYGNHLVIPKPFICRVDEDIDNDGNLDINEDSNNNGVLDAGEDVDGDNRLDFRYKPRRKVTEGKPIKPTPGTTIEVVPEEDADSDFVLDSNEDANGNSLLDTYRDLFENYLQGALPGKILHFIDDWYIIYRKGKSTVVPMNSGISH